MSSRYGGWSIEDLQVERNRLIVEAFFLERSAPVLGEDVEIDRRLDDLYARLDAIDALLRELVAR